MSRSNHRSSSVVAVAILLSLGLLTGCGGASNVTAAPTPVPSGDEASHQLRFAMADRSGFAAYSEMVDTVTVRDGIAEVATSVPAEEDDRIRGLCVLLSDLLYNGDQIQDVAGFEIRAADGSLLIRRDAMDQSC